MKIKAKDYLSNIPNIKNILRLRPETCRNRLATEIAACMGIPLVVVLLFIIQIEGPNAVLAEKIQRVNKFYEMELEE